MKSFYYVFATDANGKRRAYAETICCCTNLMSVINKTNNLKYVMPVSSLKEAQRTADSWNDGYIDAGVYDDDSKFIGQNETRD